MYLPSQRFRVPTRTRIRPKTVKVWRCRVCKEIYDVPMRGCPKCNAGENYIYETRVKD